MYMSIFENCCKKSHILLILMILITIGGAFLLGILWQHKSTLRNAGEKIIELCGFDPSSLKQKIDEKIIEHNRSFYLDEKPFKIISNLSISENQTLTLPVTISGTVDTGNWFFEGSFPVQLLKPDGEKILDTYATATGEWMVDTPVGFTVKISDINYKGSATIVFTQNDPSDGESGKPIKEFRLPIVIQ